MRYFVLCTYLLQFHDPNFCEICNIKCYSVTCELQYDINIFSTSMHVIKQLDHCLRILSHIIVQLQPEGGIYTLIKIHDT
jgi:hypothetical protein